ncbi:hypothetical protein ACLB2K_037721 [Fragaria x ananassa]
MAPKPYRKPKGVCNKLRKMSRRNDDVAGSPVLNDITDAFLWSATIAATKAAAEGTYYAIQRGSVSSHDFECTLKRMGEEGVYWGTTAGLFVTTEYGLESVRDRSDWKNTLIAGAVTGAVMSAVNKNNKDKILTDAIVGGAVATAAYFIRNFRTAKLLNVH